MPALGHKEVINNYVNGSPSNNASSAYCLESERERLGTIDNIILFWLIEMPESLGHDYEHQEAVETTKRSVSAPKCQSQGSYSSELFKFHDFFHDLFKCFKTIGLVVTLKNV